MIMYIYIYMIMYDDHTSNIKSVHVMNLMNDGIISHPWRSSFCAEPRWCQCRCRRRIQIQSCGQGETFHPLGAPSERPPSCSQVLWLAKPTETIRVKDGKWQSLRIRMTRLKKMALAAIPSAKVDDDVLQSQVGSEEAVLTSQNSVAS